jgi:hypothetical protein
LGDPLKGNLLLFYKPLHLEAQQVSTRIEVRRHQAPISEIISNKDASGRIPKWAIELSPYTPRYDKRDTIKSQVLADFFIDWAKIQYEPPLPDANY